MPPAKPNLRALALNLAEYGPYKTLPTTRRVRLLIKGHCLVDTSGTSGAVFVWEHENYPQYYFPYEAFFQTKGHEIRHSSHDAIKNDVGRQVASLQEIHICRADGKEGYSHVMKDSVLKFEDDLEGPARALAGLWKVDFDAVDQWLEEDTPIFVHPKDPFKRVDILTSTRPIKVKIDGVIIAETTTSMHLYETSLLPRYYMPLTAIDTSVLRPSPTKTQCPYKGEAEYYSVVVNGKEYKDIVWFYNRPTVECAAVAGMCCFYNEKVEIWMHEGNRGWELRTYLDQD